jgi:hypothetical protein
MAPKFRRALLASVAAEMNEVMGLTPLIQEDMADDTLLTTICYEATGRGILKDAIRADDFDSDDSGKKTFTPPVAKFFADAGVWDAEAQAPIMPTAVKPRAAKAEPVAVDAEPELPLDACEQAEHDEMEAGEPAADPIKEVMKEKLKKSNVVKEKSTKPAKAEVAEKEAVVAKTTKAAVKTGVSRATATAKKRAAKSVKAVKKVGVKKADAVEKDRFGIRVGSIQGKALEILATGKATMADVKKKLGKTYYGALNLAVAGGFKVEKNENGTYKITSKK